MDAAATKELEDIPAYKELLQFFITPEVRYLSACLLSGTGVMFCHPPTAASLVCFKPGASVRIACHLTEGVVLLLLRLCGAVSVILCTGVLGVGGQHALAGQTFMEASDIGKTLNPAVPLRQVVWWGVFSKRYEDEIAAQAEVFGGPGGAARLKALRMRITEHNVLVVAKYYSRITLARLAELLDLPAEEARPAWGPAALSSVLGRCGDTPRGVC